jgi:phosphoglycolate phosphatase-like HAD superfamily hydrolase
LILRAVVVDVDDTLVRTPIDWYAVRRRIEEVTGVYIAYRPLIEGIYRYLDRDSIPKALEVVEEAELSSATAVALSTALVELVRNLRGCGCRFAVVTLRGLSSARVVLERLGLTPYVDALVTREDCIDRVRQVELALERLGVGRRSAVFVGDSPADLDVALRLGLATTIVREPTSEGVPPQFLEVLGRYAYLCCRELRR